MDMFNLHSEEEQFPRESAKTRRPEPWKISVWVAMAALQKAIRRNHQEVALRAASTLLASEPWRLWRRLMGICFEDVGYGAFDRMQFVVETISSKASRLPIEQEWEIAARLVMVLCPAAKDRSADDLLIAAFHHPQLAAGRQEIANLSVAEKLMRLAEPGSLLGKAMAVVDLVPGRSKTSLAANVAPRRIWGALSSAGYQPNCAKICEAGYRKTRELLPMMLLLLSSSQGSDETIVSPEGGNFTLLPTGLPSYALDMFSHEGKAALSMFLRSATETSRWLSDQVHQSRRGAFLGGLLFRVEGAVVNARLRSNVADSLRKLADNGFHGDPNIRTEDAADLLRADFATLNDIRARFMDH